MFSFSTHKSHNFNKTYLRLCTVGTPRYLFVWMELNRQVCVVDDAVISIAVFSVQLFLHFFLLFSAYFFARVIEFAPPTPWLMDGLEQSQPVTDSFMRNLSHHAHSPGTL